MCEQRAVIHISDSSDTESSGDDEVQVIDSGVPDNNDDVSEAKNTETSDDLIIIDKEDDNSLPINSVNNTQLKSNCVYDTYFNENALLVEFIEKCLELEHSEGMLRVINRNLLNAFKNVDPKYKKSRFFKIVLNKMITKVDNDPSHKFSHVRDLCERLRVHRVQLRSSNLNKTGSDRRFYNGTDRSYDTKQANHNSEVIDLEDSEQEDDVILLDSNSVGSGNSNKENNIKETKSDDSQKNYITIEVPSLQQSTVQESQHIKPTELLLPLKEVPYTQRRKLLKRETVSLSLKIKQMEAEIELLMMSIKDLDNQEVWNDSKTSPYLLGEEYKKRVVYLYKKLCQLTGSEEVKRHEVRLQVSTEHAQGPIRCLEKFINENLGSNGEPCFPDFQDVVQCVWRGVTEDNLRWDATQIYFVAKSLFTQYGRSVQRRRQVRELRDLMAFVKEEPSVDDPADRDAQLAAKLDENRRIGMAKEKEILERYTRMSENKGAPTMCLNISTNEDQSEPSTSHINNFFGDSSSLPTVSTQSIKDNTTAVHSRANFSLPDPPGPQPRLSEPAQRLLSALITRRNGGTTQTNRGIIQTNGGTTQTFGGNTQPNGGISQRYDGNIQSNGGTTQTNEGITHTTGGMTHTNGGIAQTFGGNIQPIGGITQTNGENTQPNGGTTLRNGGINSHSAERLEGTDGEPVALSFGKLPDSAPYRVTFISSETEKGPSIIYPEAPRDTLQTAPPDTEVQMQTGFTKEYQSFCSKLLNKPPPQKLRRINPILCKTNPTDSQTPKIVSVWSDAVSTSNIHKNCTSDIQENIISSVTPSDLNGVEDKDDVKVKIESEDVAAMLEALGDNFTATIIDIEDPFLIMEISDSSDSEGERNC